MPSTNLHAELRRLTRLEGRRPDSTAEESEGSYAHLGEVGSASAYISSFSGVSEWERHSSGDELVQVLEGETELRILGSAPETLQLSAGSYAVVPQGAWHRFSSAGGVSLFTLTPQPTDHFAGDDPATFDASLP